MQTLYIDVYFLINFTVDLLAIYFSVRLNKISRGLRVILGSAALGALQAVIYILFFENSAIGVIFSVFYFVSLAFIIGRGLTNLRKARFIITFAVLQMLIGGSVYYMYELMNRFFDLGEEEIGVENRNLLILSLMILLTVGVLKLCVNVFTSSKTVRCARLYIEREGKRVYFDALVDSGNFAADPMDKTPVMLVNRKLFSEIFGISKLPDEKFKSQIRIIPIRRGNDTKLYYGIRTKDIIYVKGRREEKLTAVIVIDNNEFAGYRALMPLSLILE